MARVRLTADVDPELRRRVKIAAASSDKTVSQWVEDAIRREIEHPTDSNAHRDNGTTMPPGAATPEGELALMKIRGEGKLTLEDRDALAQMYPDMHLAPPGVKPQGLSDPPKLREGSGTVADAVIDDRRQALIIYLDTSALVKLYVVEHGRDTARAAVAASTEVAISTIAYAEACAALTRKRNDGDLDE